MKILPKIKILKWKDDVKRIVTVSIDKLPKGEDAVNKGTYENILKKLTLI
jgi:hypothetical protein